MKTDLEKLKAIVEAGKKLTSVLELDDLLNVILDVALKELEAERGTVYLMDAERGAICSRILRGKAMSEICLPLGQGIAGKVAATGDVVIISDAYSDPRFDPEIDRRSGFRTKSILCLPLKKGDGEILGVLQLLNKREGRFSKDDADYLEALAAHMVIALENAKAHKARLEQERTQKEIELAAQIQQRLLPQRIPAFPGLSAAVRATPCRYVGGDYYDIMILPDGSLGVLIADVSGKGIPAAMITSALHAYLHALWDDYVSPSALAARLNRLLHASILTSSFLTLIFMEIQPELERLTFCNCGHNPMVLVHGEKRILLKATGTIVGMFPKIDFKQEELAIAKGDRLLLYTDGLTEAARGEGENREEFGMSRLLAHCRPSVESPERWLTEIEGAVSVFTEGRPLDDDLTMIALSFREGSSGGDK
jgi:sigma-B regulation protein RsbU (phosphoserine phosphatase)